MSKKKESSTRKVNKGKKEIEKLSTLTIFLASLFIGFFSFYTFPWSRNAWPVAFLIGAFVGLFSKNLLTTSLISLSSSYLVFLLNTNYFTFRPHYQLDLSLSYLVPSLNPAYSLFAGLTSLLAALVFHQLSATVKDKKILIFVLLSLILLNYLFVATGYNEALRLAATEPPDEGYRFDPIMFLKTFYLMERGLPYYKAYAEGFKRDTAHNEYPEYTETFRFPTIFYLWKLLCPPSGSFVNLLFAFFALTSLLASFFLVWKFSSTPLALVAPILLVPYLLYGNLTMWFLATEYWALFFGLLFTTFYLYNLPLASLGTALFAALIREFGIFYLIAGALASWFKKEKKERLFWTGAIGVFFLAYFFHLKAAKVFTAGTPARSFFAWQAFRLDAFKAITEYGFVLVPFNQFWAFPLLFLSLLGIFLLKLEKQIKAFLLVNLLLPLVVFLALGRDPGAGYWGVVWMPVVLSSFPLFLLYLDKILIKAMAKGKGLKTK